MKATRLTALSGPDGLGLVVSLSFICLPRFWFFIFSFFLGG